MAKVRVYEAAQSLGIPNELVVECLGHLGVPVKNHMSSVEDRHVDCVKQVFAAGSKKPGATLEELAKGIAKVAGEKERAEEAVRKKAEEAKKAEEDKAKAEAAAAQKKADAEAEGKDAGKSPINMPPPPTVEKEGKTFRSPAKKKQTKKDRSGHDSDMYSSPAKRLDAIRKRKGQLQGGSKGTKTTFVQKGDRRGRQDKSQAAEQQEINRNIKLGRAATVKDVSQETGIKAAEIMKFLLKDLSVMATINQGLDRDVVQLIADHFGFEVSFKEVLVSEEIVLDKDNEEDLVERPPVMAIMGHVDHGKTKLLDTIRNTNVVDGESGGITQHIGAYQIMHNDRAITFLDTPGHESFTSLRARGAKVTDITILVVAADDGVMPQTIEAIHHAKEAEVPILVAVNKIDKPQANPDRVKQQLTEHGLQPEDWGGDTVFVHISALKGDGVSELLDMIFLLADVQEPKANPKRKANGSVIEAQLDKGKGPVATVLGPEWHTLPGRLCGGRPDLGGKCETWRTI